MKNPLLAILLLFAFTALVTESCYYDNEAELHPEKALAGSLNCDTTVVMSYNDHIKPILNSSCGTTNSCHSTSNTSGITLNNYQGVKAEVDNGRLYSSVSWDGNFSFMPKNSTARLNDCLITRIRLWIENGAPNN